MNDEPLRQAFLRGESRVGSAPGCPPYEDFWAACRGELAKSDLEALLDHALLCGPCTEALALAREIASGAEAPHSAGRRLAPGRWTVLAAAAALLILLVAPIAWERLGPHRHGETLRESAEPPPALRSMLSERPTLSRSEFELRWTGAPAGAVYTLEVATHELRVIERVENLRQPTHRVPSERLVGLEPGSTLLWRVEAVLPDGRRLQLPAARVVLGD